MAIHKNFAHLMVLAFFEKCCCAFSFFVLFADTTLIKYDSLLFIFEAVDGRKVKKRWQEIITVRLNLDQGDFISLTTKLITALS